LQLLISLILNLYKSVRWRNCTHTHTHNCKPNDVLV